MCYGELGLGERRLLIIFLFHVSIHIYNFNAFQAKQSSIIVLYAAPLPDSR